MAITQIKGSNIEDGTIVAADVKDDSITNAKIKSDAAIDASKLGTIPASKLSGTLDLSSKTVTLPAASVTAHATTPTLDSPVITGTLAVLDSGTVTHTIANWSDDLSYTITPTNCTAGAVNASGQFVITHTSGSPSYTIKATTASLGLADSALVTKNIVMQLTAPTLSSPADGPTATDVVYTITSTSTGDDKLILDPGTANFTYQSESGPGTASKVGNTVECIGFGTGNPVVTIQFTAQATYSVTAKAVNIAGTYGTSVDSAADSITIANALAASGGTEGTYTYDSVDYKWHKFLTTGATNLVVTSAPAGKTMDVLVIAGGGGGGGARHGACSGGGGGAGGLRWFTAQSPSAATYVATIGAGGAGGSATYGAKGTNSSFIGTGISITGTGGGGGERNHAGHATQHGGSGGGASADDTGLRGHTGLGNQGSYTPVEGYNGGGPIEPVQNGHGGGGSGGIPTVLASTTRGGDGGAGEDNFLNQSSTAFTVAATKALLDSIGVGEVSSSSRHIAAGGGGGYYTSTNIGYGGLGFAGNGGDGTAAPTAATVNTGSGGGGGGGSIASGSTQAGANGGSGIVVVRYLA